MSGIIPLLIIFAPFEIYRWGTAALMHLALQAVSGMLLSEAIFWTFDKVPFTCSWFPGRVNLALLVGLYLYGFTSYSFRMADLETWMDANPRRGVAVIAAGLIGVGLIWRWKNGIAMIRFDGTESEIQVLDLSG